MQGRLCLHGGVLYVGRHVKTAEVRSFDMDGHPLETRFTFRDEAVGRSEVSGLSVDEDHRIWVADAPCRRVRAFSLFGREVSTLGGSEAEAEDQTGRIGAPTGVLAFGADADLELLVASGGVRRHALQFFHLESGRVLSLRPFGDPEARFHDACGVARSGRFVYVCERRGGRVQVFRDGDFHFCFRVPAQGGAAFEPVAIAPLPGGRMIVATGGTGSAILSVDAAGALRGVLASAGTESGSVFEPGDVVVENGAEARATRLAVIDKDGERVQVFTLDGRCYGSIAEL
ncbi:MAG: hypothetical protein E2O39_15035 [Planctomycetota bacterium]|nr:MAG: hypothetical protein E2O39_15035 [Planctomycetota bacterium]